MAASRNPRARLSHIRDEINQLEQALEGVPFETFSTSYVLRRTAEHGILIISEAVRALSPILTDAYAGIDWQAIRGIGSVLRHDYFEINPIVLWGVVRERLPELAPVIDTMIADLDRSS